MQLEAVALEELSNAENLMQSRFWGRLKRRRGDSPYAFRLSAAAGETGLLALVHELPGGCYAYLPLAPDLWVTPEQRGSFLEELSGLLAEHLPRDCRFIRFDLPWETPYAAGEAGDFDTADGRPAPHIRELRMNFGTSSRNLRKAPTDIQPADTLRLRIDRDEARLLRGMKSKTRYNIRLASRKGVQVWDVGSEKLEQWYRLYRETAARKGIVLHGIDYFSDLFQTFRRHSTPNLDLRLLLAESSGTPLAGIILALHGSVATYLYGASGEAGRGLMPAYRLQWEAIRLARAESCTLYDFFGIPPAPQPAHPMYGLYRFKRGFGGSRLSRQGCWDYPLDETEYLRYAEAERIGGGYHLRR
jgi:lipid II:glycine glycyltransferase (peptidoglycan interpeptide bridge formation enzyme)